MSTTSNNRTNNNIVTIHDSKQNYNEVCRLLDKYNYDNPMYNNKVYTYGTAGFRYNAIELSPIIVRVGIVVSLIALTSNNIIINSITTKTAENEQEQQNLTKVGTTGTTTTGTTLPNTNTVGIMITASHNDESYNGIKIAQSPDGGMLNNIGEQLATIIVNERITTTILNYISTILSSSTNTTTTTTNTTTNAGIVHIGYDTREHSKGFCSLLIKVIIAMGCVVYDHGIVTTPMLHHCIKHNTSQYLPALIPYRPYIIGYYDLLINSYCTLLQTKKRCTSSSSNNNTKKNIIYVDCACGVGYEPIHYIANHPLVQYLQQQQQQSNSSTSTSTIINTTQIIPFNIPGSGPLNENCGSEYVQKDLSTPTIYSTGSIDDNNNNTINFNNTCTASIDGDADRIVFFYTTTSMQQGKKEQLHLLDGDKIAILVCQFIKEQLNILNQYDHKVTSASSSLTSSLSNSVSTTIRMGVVQTAYANGSSTKYLQNIVGINNVLIAKTGVKFVHEMAHTNFDIGIYFEANGHGTILFNTNFYQYMYNWEKKLENIRHSNSTTGTSMYSQDVYIAYQRLRILPSLVNQAVGDAISDLLLIDCILQLSTYNTTTTIQQWDSLYTDMPSRQCKVQVVDRSIIITNDNETLCIEPSIVQIKLNDAIQKINQLQEQQLQEQQQSTQNNNTNYNNNNNISSRVFIRPSGTENVVRIYAEAITRQLADTLANYAIDIVYDYCNGIGEKPSYFPTTATTTTESFPISSKL